MSYCAVLELTLPDFAHVRLNRHVAVFYADVLEIVRVGLTCPGDVSERVGTMARLFEALPERWDPEIEEVVTDWLGFTAYADLREGAAVIQYKQGGQWMRGELPQNVFRDSTLSSVWTYLHVSSNPLSGHHRG